ncbi:putative amino-acid acetyltransferase NAGS2, chloroplastic [Morella rubra]|uniref:amino-acid N-acetyltransferase n=1 Tax=Morella rubra TaxID=262757 RepID=A0A6A1VTP0_9ROSI|nr:putative amino-acid acetyltransferase NAGS2, chloroplastic [Morella rubra]
MAASIRCFYCNPIQNLRWDLPNQKSMLCWPHHRFQFGTERAKLSWPPSTVVKGKNGISASFSNLEGDGGNVLESTISMEDQRRVRWFRETCSYLCPNKGCTFVVIISGKILCSPFLDSILKDIAYLHHLGIRFVIVLETYLRINQLLEQRGSKPTFVGEYRITDAEALTAAIHAAEEVRSMLAAKLSAGPSISNVHRHGDGSRWHAVNVTVDCNCYIGARRKGVIRGIDYGATGEVKRVDASSMCKRLDSGCIVIQNNIGHSSSGELLNCNTYEVATACALAIGADKLICIIDGQILDENGHLISFLTLQEADMLIRERAKQNEIAFNCVKAVGEEDLTSPKHDGPNGAFHSPQNGKFSGRRRNITFRNGVGFDNGNGLGAGEQCFAIGSHDWRGRLSGYLSELAAAAFVCGAGVKRVHLLDGTIDGVLSLELTTRDGKGTMVASDLYEGTRMARLEDLNSIRQIMQPLEESGILVCRTDQELLEELESFIVMERDGEIIACAALFPFFEERCGEVAAIAVSPDCRGLGQGYKLLDYIEKKASSIGLEMLFLLTTQTADWFVRRGFFECSIESIPEKKRKKINLSRNSKYYMKKLLPDTSGIAVDSQVI